MARSLFFTLPLYWLERQSFWRAHSHAHARGGGHALALSLETGTPLSALAVTLLSRSRGWYPPRSTSMSPESKRLPLRVLGYFVTDAYAYDAYFVSFYFLKRSLVAVKGSIGCMCVNLFLLSFYLHYE